jgi:hypothetical protein
MNYDSLAWCGVVRIVGISVEEAELSDVRD